MKKLGLVLEGGGMRGVYTAGVLDYFLEHEIEVDGVIGVSAGSCHATSYISKQHGRNLRVNTSYLKDKNYLSMHSLIKTGSLFGMKMLFDDIPNRLDPYDYEAFNKRKCEFICVSTNIETGEADYRVINDMMKDASYLQASSSLPLLSKFVEIDGKKLMDGGCSDSIPFKYMQEHGYEFNIAVLTQSKEYRKGKNNLIRIIGHNYKDYPKLVKALSTRHFRYNQTLDEIAKSQRENKVFVIRPSKPVSISRLERDEKKLKDLYQLGYNDAAEQFIKLKEFINQIKN